jgi:hypothetical protein
LACVVHGVAGAGVEIIDVDKPCDDDDRGVAAVLLPGRPPVTDELLADCIGRLADGDALVSVVGLHRTFRVAGSQLVEGVALPFVSLASVLG